MNRSPAVVRSTQTIPTCRRGRCQPVATDSIRQKISVNNYDGNRAQLEHPSD
jgi:hypothetical protein